MEKQQQTHTEARLLSNVLYSDMTLGQEEYAQFLTPDVIPMVFDPLDLILPLPDICTAIQM